MVWDIKGFVTAFNAEANLWRQRYLCTRHDFLCTPPRRFMTWQHDRHVLQTMPASSTSCKVIENRLSSRFERQYQCGLVFLIFFKKHESMRISQFVTEIRPLIPSCTPRTIRSYRYTAAACTHSHLSTSCSLPTSLSPTFDGVVLNTFLFLNYFYFISIIFISQSILFLNTQLFHLVSYSQISLWRIS